LTAKSVIMVEDGRGLRLSMNLRPTHCLALFVEAGGLRVKSSCPIRELFPHCIEASRILGLDTAFRARLETALTRIPPYQIGKSGFVQEWIEDGRPGPQGHNVSSNFLPALPSQWPNGSVSGLRARGGYEVDMRWKGGKLQTADIRGLKGGPISARYGQRTATVMVKPGQTAHLNADLATANQERTRL
jgi:Glycoside hydrolase family 95, C-terminal domain/Glycosyl hydrolase family 95 catalytic domain